MNPSAPVTLESDDSAGLRRNFLPYPASTLSPVIQPPDLSSFKSRGITSVQRELSQKLSEIRAEYVRVVDAFNWNKLIYESAIAFEPVVGHSYHLYREGDTFSLSMIEPGQWSKQFVGTFRLGYNGKWEPEEVAPDFELQEFLLSRQSGDG